MLLVRRNHCYQFTNQPVQIFGNKMTAAFSGNTEAGFVFATLVEFIHLWRSGRDASINIKCKEGKAALSMECNLGNPGDQHVPVPVRVKSSKKSKSVSRTARNNARAARHQAGAGPPPSTTTTPPRTATSPAPPSPTNVARTATSPAPTPPAGPDTSPASHTPARTVRPEGSDIWQPGDLDCTMAGARETLPLSPLTSPFSSPVQRTPKRVRYSQETHREESAWQPSELNDTRVGQYATVPLSPGIHRETEQTRDVSCLPSSPLPSLREEPGRQEVNKSTQIPADSLEEDDSDSSDTVSSTEDSILVDPLFVLDTDDPPSSPSSSPEREPGGRENYESPDPPDSFMYIEASGGPASRQRTVKSKKNKRKSQKKKRRF